MVPTVNTARASLIAFFAENRPNARVSGENFSLLNLSHTKMREMEENVGKSNGVTASGTPTIKNVLELRSKYEAPTADEVPTC